MKHFQQSISRKKRGWEDLPGLFQGYYFPGLQYIGGLLAYLRPLKKAPGSFSNPEVIKCFWSGGWDSSFRIIQALIIEKKTVQPIYLIDKRRRSVGLELKAMRKIRKDLELRWPECKERLLPLFVINKSSMKKNPETRKLYKSLAQEFTTGIQYEWFGRFTRIYGLKEAEVCIEKHPEHSASEFFRHLSKSLTGTGHHCKLNGFVTHPGFSLLQDGRFPVIHLEKGDMAKIAEENNFLDLMQHCWYCHTPRKDGSACGSCHPCEMAREAGNGVFIKE